MNTPHIKGRGELSSADHTLSQEAEQGYTFPGKYRFAPLVVPFCRKMSDHGFYD